jgi:hypothetical protein
MAEILNKPLNQIVIRQSVKYNSPEDLARTVVVQAGASQSVSLTWVNGIVFKISPPPFIISELLAKEFVEGRLHISVLSAEMPNFKPSIHASEEKIQIPILNESNNEEAKSIANWLKQQD